MYISGYIYDFESRLHQLPTGQSDLNSFSIEGKDYTGVIPSSAYKEKWNNEFARRSFSLSGDISYYLTGAL